jgi:hypothetical protein
MLINSTAFTPLMAETIIENTDFEEFLNNQTLFMSKLLKPKSKENEVINVNDLLEAFKFNKKISDSHSFKLLFGFIKIVLALSDSELLPKQRMKIQAILN